MNAKKIFLELLKIGINREQSTDFRYEIDDEKWNQIHALAKANQVNNIILEAFEFLPENIKPNSKVKDIFFQDGMMNSLLDSQQEVEIKALVKQFDDNNIPVVMLKGWINKKLYPRSDLRSMCDTDIFMNEHDQKRVEKIFSANGYKMVAYGEKKDDVYSKPPFITVEMHKSLFMYEDKWNTFFKKIWSRTEKLDDYKNALKMDKELHFVYMLAHMAKHLIDDGGIGVRAFLDIYVYNKAYKNCLDYDLIKSDLKELGLDNFAEKAINLSEIWFGNYSKNDIDQYKQFSEYILGNGVYGSSDNFVMNNEVMRNNPKYGKWRYIFARAFPSKSLMEVRFPKLKKNPLLLPYYWIKRLYIGGFKRKDFIKREIKGAENLNYDKMNEIRNMYDEWGLNNIN